MAAVPPSQVGKSEKAFERVLKQYEEYVKVQEEKTKSSKTAEERYAIQVAPPPVRCVPYTESIQRRFDEIYDPLYQSSKEAHAERLEHIKKWLKLLNDEVTHLELAAEK